MVVHFFHSLQICLQVIEDKLEERRQRTERKGAIKRQSMLIGNSNNAPQQAVPTSLPPPSSTGLVLREPFKVLHVNKSELTAVHHLRLSTSFSTFFNNSYSSL